MSMKNTNPTKVITGIKTRWSYANVWEAKSINGSEPKYSVSLIIPKSDTKTVNKIRKAIQAAYTEASFSSCGIAFHVSLHDIQKHRSCGSGSDSRPGTYTDGFQFSGDGKS